MQFNYLQWASSFYNYKIYEKWSPWVGNIERFNNNDNCSILGGHIQRLLNKTQTMNFFSFHNTRHPSRVH